MASFTERVSEYLAESIQDKDVQGVTNGFTIKETEEGDWIIHTSLVAKEPPSLFNDSEGGDAPLDSWDGVYEQHELPLTTELQTTCLGYITDAKSALITSKNVCITNVVIESYDDVSSVRIDWELNLAHCGFKFGELAEQVVSADASPISDAALVVDVEVRQPLADSSDESMMFPDYTIRYETEEPHKIWEGLDSLQDYAERISENNEEYSVDDVLSWETYESHYHLTGDVQPNTWLQQTLPSILESELDNGLGAGTSYTSDLVVKRNGESKLTGSIVCSISQL